MKIVSAKSTKTKTRLPPFRVNFSAGFIALIAVAYFFDDNGLLLAMLPAVLMHELGHMGVLIALGSPPRALNATLSGFSLDYSGESSPAGQVLAALSGPAAGLAFAWFCAFLGSRFESEYLLLSSGAGLVLNLFNLLPALPLDGGRALNALLKNIIRPPVVKKIMLALGGVISIVLIVCGVFFFAWGLGFSLIPAGMWLLILQRDNLE